MNAPILYNYFRSSTSYRVRIALYYKKIDFKYQPVHLLMDGGDQNKPDYEILNPLKEVPTLQIDGKNIAQSFAIIELLEDLYPTPHLFPNNPYLKATVKQFCENINAFMHPVCNLQILKHLETKHQYNQSQKEEWVQHWLKKGFIATEELLKKHSGKYSFGDSLTAADLFLIPQIFTAQRFNCDLTNYKNVMKVNENCLELECFKKAHPFRQPDTPEELILK